MHSAFLSKKLDKETITFVRMYLYLYFASLSVRLFVSINVKMAYPIEPKFCVGPLQEGLWMITNWPLTKFDF